MQIERQLQGVLNTIFTEVIKEQNLQNTLSPYPTTEENRADITLKDAKGKPIFFIELKDPIAKDGKSVFDPAIIVREIERAEKIEVEYFGICNFIATTLIDKHRISDKVAFIDGFFTLPELDRLRNDFNPQSAEIQKKLRNIANFYIEKALEILKKKTFTANPIDEIFIFKIRKLIEVYGYEITDKVFEKYQKDIVFEKRVSEYVQLQQWNKPQNYEEIENLTYIALLMLISKIIFYKSYQDAIYGNRLPKLIIDDQITTATALESIIWEYFSYFQEITGDFELLIGNKAEVIYQIPFVSDSVIDLVKDVIQAGKAYNFAETPYDIIGRIFEELIREDERHKLGQYFTPPVVIDLINAFCIQKATDKVLDPSCGSGTFLVRAYERKKQLGMQLHERLLIDIYGSDISNYAVYLAMLNLSIRNMQHNSYPRILHRDFFSLRTDKKENFQITKDEFESRLIPQFDAIVGNPPYTRQEDINAFNDKAKDQIYNVLAKEWQGLAPSKRTSIYAYFFYYAAAFLKENGYMGFVVSNSWLDTDFGKDLQQFFTQHFDIVAIIESSIERFFPSAEVNTNIVILKRQSDQRQRKANKVKFIYLHEKLAEITRKYKSAERLKDFFENTYQNTENQYFTINFVKQEELEKYDKWSLFLKAPQVYWQILERGKEKFVSLKKVAKIKFGIKTGANDFFYLKNITQQVLGKYFLAILNNKRGFQSTQEIVDANLSIVQNGLGEYWLIENELLKPVITSAREFKKYSIKQKEIENLVLMVDEAKKFKEISPTTHKVVYKDKRYGGYLAAHYPYFSNYLEHGEKVMHVNQKPTCAGRTFWWELGHSNISDFCYPYIIGAIHKIPMNQKALIDNNLFEIVCNNREDVNYVGGILNSYIFRLFLEMTGREMTGALTVKKVQVYELKELLVPYYQIDKEDISQIFKELKNKEAKSIFQELNANTPAELDIKKVDKLRLKLDLAVLKSIGFSDEESVKLVENVYKSLIHIISKRLEKSKSVKTVANSRKKVEISVYVENLKKLVEENSIKPKSTLAFAKKLQEMTTEISADKNLQKKIVSVYWKQTFDESFDLKTIEQKEQNKLF
ncbi:MAG: N-6 DNA methylase [Thermoflexibacter sp.]|jgi:methylase of polypeptide subunit release factors|nr:N-6 DNA methylase [Thermoflexibacter sp.]